MAAKINRLQDCSISSVLAMEILQFCTKPSIFSAMCVIPLLKKHRDMNYWEMFFLISMRRISVTWLQKPCLKMLSNSDIRTNIGTYSLSLTTSHLLFLLWIHDIPVLIIWSQTYPGLARHVLNSGQQHRRNLKGWRSLISISVLKPLDNWHMYVNNFISGLCNIVSGGLVHELPSN